VLDHRFRIVFEKGQPLGLFARKSARRVHIPGADVGIADNTNGAVYLLERFARQLEEGGIEIPCDAVVGHRALQALFQKLLAGHGSGALEDIAADHRGASLVRYF